MIEKVVIYFEDIESIVIASSVILYLLKDGNAISATRRYGAIKQAEEQAKKYSLKLYRE